MRIDGIGHIEYLGFCMAACLSFASGCGDEAKGLEVPLLDADLVDAARDAAPGAADARPDALFYPTVDVGPDGLLPAGADVAPDAPEAAKEDAKPSLDAKPDLGDDRPADLALDVPQPTDAVPSALDAQDGPSTTPTWDGAIELAPLDLSASPTDLLSSESGSICQSAAGLFACMWDDTITLEQTWLASQDRTIHGTVTYTMLSAGANWCSARLGLSEDLRSGTQSLEVRDGAGHLWYPQYYVQSRRIPWQVGDSIDIRYQVTVAADGRPRRSMVLSSAGRIMVYVAEAVSLEDLPPPPVALRLDSAACPSTGACGGGRYGVRAGSDGIAVPYGQSVTIDGYRISNADCADVGSGTCDSQPSRISVAMIHDMPELDAGGE